MGHESDGATSLRFSPRLAGLLAFGWAAAVASLYLFRYDGWLAVIQFCHLFAGSTFQIGPHFGEFWRGRFVDGLSVLGILAAAFAVGAIVVERWTREKNLLIALFSLAVGLWIVAAATLCVGAVSVRGVPWVLVLLVCWAWPAPRRFFNSPTGSCPKLMFVFILVAAVLNLAGAMAPPFEYDELEYHLGSLAEYQRAGHIVFLPHNFYSNLPQLTEMLYLLATTTSSDIAAKMLHWSFGVLAALATFAVAARLWSRQVAITAAALFYCMPFVQDLSSTARIDLATTFFAVLAFGGLLVGCDYRLAAIAAGCAVATKWTAIPVVLLPAVVFVGTETKSFRRSLLFCLLVLVFVLPWLLKNWLLTGNPVYPLIYGGSHWSKAQAALFAQKHYPHFNLRELWELPWRYSFTEGGAVPLLLMTAPLILLMRNADRSARRVGWLFVGAFAGWYLLTFRPWRFLFPAFPLAAMVGAYALEATGKWVRMLVVVVLCFGIVTMGLNVLVDVEEPRQSSPQMSLLTYALGQQSREEFVARIGRGIFEPIVWMNHNLPPSATVLYVGEARAYYAKHHVLWSTAFDQHPLTTNGVTHIYINTSELNRLRTNYGYLSGVDVESLLTNARLIHQSGRNMVYELNR